MYCPSGRPDGNKFPDSKFCWPPTKTCVGIFWKPITRQRPPLCFDHSGIFQGNHSVPGYDYEATGYDAKNLRIRNLSTNTLWSCEIVQRPISANNCFRLMTSLSCERQLNINLFRFCFDAKLLFNHRIPEFAEGSFNSIANWQLELMTYHFWRIILLQKKLVEEWNLASYVMIKIT